MAYATLAQVRTHLDLTGTEDDSYISDLIVRAQQVIDVFCGRSFEAAADTTKLFDAVRDVSDDGLTLYVMHDVAQITSVQNGDGVTVSASAYVKRPAGLKLKASSGVTWTYATDPEDAISITGRWAYSVSAPLDIQHACIRLAAYLYRQRESGAEIDRPIVSESGMVLMPATLPKDVRDMLTARKRIGR